MDALPGLAVWRWPLAIIALVLALAPFLIVVSNYPTLPGRIPTHYGLSGRPDRWGARWQIWIYVVLAWGIYLALGRATGLLPWMNAGAVAPRTILLIAPIDLLVLAMVAYVCRITVRVARGQAQGLNRTIFYTLLAVVLGQAVASAVASKL
jgi:uncharacterized membrane protein